MIAASAVDWKATGHEVLNYEGPFGVGYGVAVLCEEELQRSSAVKGVAARPVIRDGAALPAVARQAVRVGLGDSSEAPPEVSGRYLNEPRGVFVTIRDFQGVLRGCVGTFVPACPNLVAETWRSAQLAAQRDARFTPVQLNELASLRFEVSVIHSLEEITSVAGLDPRRYGVVVSTEDDRRGLLLPGVSGIRSAAQQLNMACEKGWIDVREAKTIRRFQVDQFAEPNRGNYEC